MKHCKLFDERDVCVRLVSIRIHKITIEIVDGYVAKWLRGQREIRSTLHRRRGRKKQNSSQNELNQIVYWKLFRIVIYKWFPFFSSRSNAIIVDQRFSPLRFLRLMVCLARAASNLLTIRTKTWSDILAWILGCIELFFFCFFVRINLCFLDPERTQKINTG